MVRPALTFVPTLGLLHRHLCVPPQQPLQKLSGLARPLAELWIASERKMRLSSARKFFRRQFNLWDRSLSLSLSLTALLILGYFIHTKDSNHTYYSIETAFVGLRSREKLFNFRFYQSNLASNCRWGPTDA